MHTGTINESAIEHLELVLQCAQRMEQAESDKANDSISITNDGSTEDFLPNFLWILRDFALKMVDEHGNELKEKG